MDTKTQLIQMLSTRLSLSASYDHDSYQNHFIHKVNGNDLYIQIQIIGLEFIHIIMMV